MEWGRSVVAHPMMTALACAHRSGLHPEERERTYVAFTSSLAGTGGIPEAIVCCVVACSGALFGGDFLRVRNFIVGTAVSQTDGLFINCFGRYCS
jgi:hypothetical protein